MKSIANEVFLLLGCYSNKILECLRCVFHSKHWFLKNSVLEEILVVEKSISSSYAFWDIFKCIKFIKKLLTKPIIFPYLSRRWSYEVLPNILVLSNSTFMMQHSNEGVRFGRKRSWPNFKYSDIRLKLLRKTTNTLLKITGLRVEIWCRDLPNT
jgi:hypothetical protein